MDGDTTRPYFALVNLFDAHDPYVAPERFRRVSPANDQQRWLLRHWWISDKCVLTDEQVEFEKTCYEDCVASIDDEIGKLLDQLRRRGRIENTLVIVTADHGEHFGDHELYGHGNSLYEPAILVPLIIWRSDATLRGVSNRMVSLTEIPATIAHEAAPDVQTPFPGETLARFFPPGSATDQESPVHSEIAKPARWPACGGRSPVFRGSMRSVIWRGYKYIRNGDGVEEIYQLAEDPAELNNLADSVSPQLRSELRSVLGN
jgi:arylsulfatase A-like enzyme